MKKKTKLYIYSIIAGCAAGTVIWELLCVIFRNFGFNLYLSAGPVGFDISVISFYVKINLGTVLGGAVTFFIVKKF